MGVHVLCNTLTGLSDLPSFHSELFGSIRILALAQYFSYLLAKLNYSFSSQLLFRQSLERVTSNELLKLDFFFLWLNSSFNVTIIPELKYLQCPSK